MRRIAGSMMVFGRGPEVWRSKLSPEEVARAFRGAQIVSPCAGGGINQVAASLGWPNSRERALKRWGPDQFWSGTLKPDPFGWWWGHSLKLKIQF